MIEGRRGEFNDLPHSSLNRQIIRVAKFWREYAGAKPIEAIDDKVMRRGSRPPVNQLGQSLCSVFCLLVVLISFNRQWGPAQYPDAFPLGDGEVERRSTNEIT